MVHGVEGFTNVSGDNGSPHRRLPLIKPPRHRGGDGEKSGRRRTEGAEAVLVIRQFEGLVAVREEKPFQHLDAGREEGDRAIAPPLARRLPRL